MKTLLIMRHTKSSWDDDDLSDHDRPLNGRGQRDAPRMAQCLMEHDLVPDRIYASTALRARSTAEIIAQTSGFSGDIELRPELYHAEPSDYIGAVKESNGAADRVLLIGHNPGLEDLLERLTGKIQFFPTAALAQIEVPVENWEQLSLECKGRLVEIWRPKEL